jgi:hypothetical protein
MKEMSGKLLKTMKEMMERVTKKFYALKRPALRMETLRCFESMVGGMAQREEIQQTSQRPSVLQGSVIAFQACSLSLLGRLQ